MDKFKNMSPSCTFLFLSELQSMNHETLIEAGCNYLYYSLENNGGGTYYNQENTNLFYKFLTVYGESLLKIPHKCKSRNVFITMSDSIILKLIDDMYTEYNSLNWRKMGEVGENILMNFYSKADFFISQYNEHIETNEMASSEIRGIPVSEKENSCKTNILFPIVVTFVVTTLSSILLFIFFKFTAFGPSLIYKIFMKRNYWCDIDEKRK
ncbi:variable surface protein [Plasmodium gonderi]|uniref:Variable surface protein n=1 Tax=Plasmodium gonderi TaxID=77519 RepID=A0A1Y1JUC0_PLAGO|nr:variable surface protein [Plasmodium gonderi]GAW84003.1 variable surface protein [Plasmodium gonderi]